MWVWAGAGRERTSKVEECEDNDSDKSVKAPCLMEGLLCHDRYGDMSVSILAKNDRRGNKEKRPQGEGRSSRLASSARSSRRASTNGQLVL